MGAGGRHSETLGEVIATRRRGRFVGRSAEIELFRTALTGTSGCSVAVFYLHGPGGIGKTSLLDVLGDVATGSGATLVRLGDGDMETSPVSVLEQLGEVLEVPDGDRPIGLVDDLARLVLLLDSYERMEGLDDWIRTRLLPRLTASTITVIADRNPPSLAWRSDPGWGDLLRVVSLRNLSPDDSRTFLHRVGIDGRRHEQILRATYGHPLALALLSDVVATGGDFVESAGLPLDVVDALVPRFVDAVPDNRRRRVLAASALARRTTEPLLRAVLEDSDVHEEFGWLQGLSFVESRLDGLAPHDLARDVLDADLRWRDFDGYREVFHKVRTYSLAALRTTSGRAQQRAIFDLKFLFRHVRTAMSPVEWDTWGEHYPEPARPADHAQILGLVRAWEGEESAAIAARWLGLQPEGFWVIRNHQGEVEGTVAIVDLVRCPTDDVDADPAARAAWAFAERTAPPRSGEALTVCRFVIDRQGYQGPSPTLNATPILTLQRQLATPHLSWDFLVLADADRWDEYFAAADLPRAQGADFSVGGRGYGMFAHDFRAVPVDTITELWTDRALAAGVEEGPRTKERPHLVLSHPDFEAAVRQGFKDLRRPDLLARNPLARTRLVAEHTRGTTPASDVLRSLLRDAAGTLAEHPSDDKLLRAVDRTYLHPAATQEAAAAALGLPFSTYRRHLTRGMSRIVEVLWDQEVYGQARAPVSTA